MTPSDHRRNPIDGSISYRPMDPETYTIGEFDELPNVFGARLLDKPAQGSITVTSLLTGGGTYTIVGSTPNPGEVFIDYEGGYLLFHPTEDGNPVEVNYQGGGTIATHKVLGRVYQAEPTNTYATYNGDQVWRAVINVPNLPIPNSILAVPLTIPVANLFKVEGTIKSDTGDFYPITIAGSDFLTWKIGVSGLEIVNGPLDRSAWRGTYILEYIP